MVIDTFEFGRKPVPDRPNEKERRHSRPRLKEPRLQPFEAAAAEPAVAVAAAAKMLGDHTRKIPKDNRRKRIYGNRGYFKTYFFLLTTLELTELPPLI